MRRSRPACSPELQAFLRLLSHFTTADVMLAGALADAEWNIARAAPLLSVSYDAVRQRLHTLASRVEEAIPGFSVRRGGVGHEVSVDQHPGLGWSTGLTDHRLED